MSEQQSPPKHLPIRPDWLALHVEEILEPDLPIIDPHHHFWDKPENRYLLFDLLADIATGHDIRATMFIECEAMYRRSGDPALRSLGETEFATGFAAMSESGGYGPCAAAAGLIGHVDLRHGDRARALLEAHIAASGGRLRGVRNISAWHADPTARGSLAMPPPGLLQDPAFRQGFAALAPLGLAFDAWMYHTQLAELPDLARAFPETTIVMNHVGGAIGIGPYAGHRDAVFKDWAAGIAGLAKCPNISIKLGGLGMRLFGFRFQEAARPPSSAELAEAWRPYVLTSIEAFGPDRCLFESNFPVDKATCSYQVLWNTFKRIAADFTPAEKQALFFNTANRVYRLGQSLEGTTP